MSKIGIITLNGYFNYGNRLQNYALQEFIKMHGYECETIINNTFLDKSELLAIKKKNIIQKILDKDLKQICSTINKKINSGKISNINKQRSKIFKEFSNEYINETSFSISVGAVDIDLEKNYDYLVCGSDQIWNPFDSMVSEVSFLTFAPKHKRISYAPSFGVYDIPQQEKENYN